MHLDVFVDLNNYTYANAYIMMSIVMSNI